MSLTNALPKLEIDIKKILVELEAGQGSFVLSDKTHDLCAALLEFLLQAQVNPGQAVSVSPGIVVATTSVLGPAAGATTAPGVGTVTSPGTLL